MALQQLDLELRVLDGLVALEDRDVRLGSGQGWVGVSTVGGSGAEVGEFGEVGELLGSSYITSGMWKILLSG